MNDFKYYEVTVTSMETLKAWMKVPASIDEEKIWLRAREIDGASYVSDSEGDWQLDEVLEIDSDSENMNEPIEYTMKDFKLDEGNDHDL